MVTPSGKLPSSQPLTSEHTKTVNPCSQRLINLFNENGCLIRIFEKPPDEEIQMLEENEKDQASTPLAKNLEASTLIQKDLPVPIFLDYDWAGFFLDPRGAKVSYKQETCSLFLERIYPDLRDSNITTPEEKLNFIVSELNGLDGLGRGKKELKNFRDLTELFYKLTEQTARQEGTIEDIGTKEVLLKHLLKFLENKTEESFLKYIENEDVPIYLRFQIIKTFNELSAKSPEISLQTLVSYLKNYIGIKKENWKDLKNLVCFEQVEVKNPPLTLEESAKLRKRSTVLTEVKKEGTLNLIEAMTKEPLKGLSDFSKKVFLEHFIQKYSVDTLSTATYEQIIICFDELAEMQTQQTNRHSAGQYRDNKANHFRKVEINEVLGHPIMSDVLGIQFHPKMSSNDWASALEFHDKMKAKGIELEFFTYDHENKAQRLVGPFTRAEYLAKQPESISKQSLPLNINK